MSPHYQIIDNFLPEEIFKELQKLVVWNTSFPWYFNTNVSGVEKEGTWYGTHLAYHACKPQSSFFGKVAPISDSFPDFRALIRIKANFYPRTDDMFEHGRHVDYEFENKAALLSLNTCDGFTRLEDGTKVESGENRMLFFDPGQKHNSSTTTNERGRFNINFNYL